MKKGRGKRKEENKQRINFDLKLIYSDKGHLVLFKELQVGSISEDI